MRYGNNRSDTAARTPPAFQRDTTRLDYRNEVIENSIGHVFVEDSFVSKLLQIQLEALQFYAFRVRHVTEDERSKVRLSRLGTHRGKLRAFDLNVILSIRERVVEALKLILERCARHRKFSSG